MNSQQYARLFEQLTPASIEDFEQIFSHDAHFCDPFNDVRGVSAIQGVFRHMFEQCEQPRFEILEVVEQGALAYFYWRFRFHRGQDGYVIEGVSRVAFDEAGKVQSHVDYWDPTVLYHKLPLLGRVLAWLRNRLGAELART